MDSVNDSLKRLQFDHIDLLYIHGVDIITPLEETMRGMEDVVRSGKVRYIGCCNIPAWMVTKANGISEKNAWNKFDALQYYYTIAGRDAEREIVPMAKSEGLALMSWSPLAGGFLTGKYTRNNQKAEGDTRRNAFDFPPVNKEKAYDIIDKMSEIAKEHQATAAQIALAWLLHKEAVTSIIIGAKTKEQLGDNLKSVDIKLSPEELSVLDKISEPVKEYPQWMIERQNSERLVN
jgi:aryl-alcohol dehydrogenase-like predicted oxidoreductase